MDDKSVHHPRSSLLVSSAGVSNVPHGDIVEDNETRSGVWIHPNEHEVSKQEEHEVYMTEIQLRRIVDRLSKQKTSAKTDGDETMVKDGKIISKFSKQSMELGDRVCADIKTKIWEVYDNNVGADAVFPLKNGAPKILTKFLVNPYSYELLDEYATRKVSRRSRL